MRLICVPDIMNFVPIIIDLSLNFDILYLIKIYYYSTSFKKYWSSLFTSKREKKRQKKNDGKKKGKFISRFKKILIIYSLFIRWYT